jgi:Transcriptional Coactivator p15 (PC4)
VTGAHLVPRGQADNWRKVADAAPALAEPITVAEWWKNRRGESIRLVLSTFEGRSILDLRTWFPGGEGKLKPGKGFAAEVRHLPRLAAAFAKAVAKARELGLIDDKATEERLHEGTANE